MRERYYLKADHQTEWSEVTREQFINAEQAAGFWSKFGPNHPATGEFSGRGMSGRVEYADDEHKGDVMERREQTATATTPRVKQLIARFENAVHQAAKDDYVDGGSYAVMDRRALAARNAKQALEDAFDNQHSQHAALVEQRDRLVAALREVRDSFDRNRRLQTEAGIRYTDEQWQAREPVYVKTVRAALATIEQPSPSTTGDEQGGRYK